VAEIEHHRLTLDHLERHLVHGQAVGVVAINVTDHPTAAWTARPLIEVFTDEAAPTYLSCSKTSFGPLRSNLTHITAPWTA
jgi:hypothetical protein